MDSGKDRVVWADPDRCGGTPCFRGTRVPISVLFANLCDGMTIDDIVESYPTLTKELAIAALMHAQRLLEAQGK